MYLGHIDLYAAASSPVLVLQEQSLRRLGWFLSSDKPTSNATEFHTNDNIAIQLPCFSDLKKIGLCMVQVQSLARLGWFLTAGSAAQQCAIVLVLVRSTDWH